MDQPVYLDIIGRGLAWLAAEQTGTGEFLTLWADNLEMRGCHPVESPFVTGWILFALGRELGEPVGTMLGRGLPFLLEKRRPGGLYAFLEKGIGPDLDDVCLLHTVLQRHLPERFAYRRVARRIARQITAEGWFPTWIEDELRPEDVDPVVNVNVIRFLFRNGFACSETSRWLRRVFADWSFEEGTRYYRSPFSLLYFAALLPGKLRQQVFPPDSAFLVRRLQERVNASLSVIDEACLLLGLATLGAPRRLTTDLAERLASRQLPEGCWPDHAVFRPLGFWSSPALSTALAVQALRKHCGALESLSQGCTNRPAYTAEYNGA
ncbi:MAG TPA: hypothetical protein VF173_38260 [Thermoanaerobaculia bacterium]|nr:hypothetical protein [Thermoanaerobaculia bacterium]